MPTCPPPWSTAAVGWAPPAGTAGFWGMDAWHYQCYQDKDLSPCWRKLHRSQPMLSDDRHHLQQRQAAHSLQSESFLAGISAEVCNSISVLINIWAVPVVGPGGRNQFPKVPSRNLLAWNWPRNRLWTHTWGCRLRYVISSDSELYFQAGIPHFAFPKDILPQKIITCFLLLCDLPLNSTFSPHLWCLSQSRYIWYLCLCCL